MEYRKFNSDYVIRIDRGEEIVHSLLMFCKQENIMLGSVTGIGAVDEVEMGLFDVTEKQYHKQILKEAFEITSLIGNVSTKDGENYLHIHVNVADKDLHTFGGHLNRAIVSATCEVVIHVLDGNVERRMDEEVGLNLFQF